MTNTNPSTEKDSPTPGPWMQYAHGNQIYGADRFFITAVQSKNPKADARLIAAAFDMWTILDELEGCFDKEIEPEQVKEDYDAPDDREYTVTITAKQWRAISRALTKANVKL